MEEFTCDVQCAFCGNDQTEHFAFNFMEADQGGCNSQWHQFDCENEDCLKRFWARAYVSFDVSADETSKKAPKKI